MIVKREVKARVCAVVVAALCCLLGLANAGIAQVFPNPNIAQNNGSSSARYNGVKKAVYFVLHDVNDPFTTSQWNSRVNSIRSKEIETRKYFAANSGGRFDIYYDQVLDIPMALNPDGTRPSNWHETAKDYAEANYDFDRNDYYMFAYDVDDTQPDPGQGWGGLSTSDRIYLQSTSQRVINHEIAHRLGIDHAKTIEPVNDSNFTPYVWNAGTSQYEVYSPGSSPFQAAPFGSALWQYGNPYDTMGRGNGHIRLQEKYEQTNWLTDSQVPRLDSSALGEGIHRIYAHDELQAVTNEQGIYGVAEGYNPSLKYGLRYQRPGQRYEEVFGNWQWVNETQVMYIEYLAGTDGLGFYLARTGSEDLDGALLDLDPRTGNSQRLLRVGSGVEDTEMGMSRFLVPAGSVGQSTPNVDFLSLNPAPPTNRANQWFHFAALGTGVDSYGSYIDLKVSLVTPLNGIAGDLDQSGFVDEYDLELFIEGWRTDTSMLSSVEKYYYGDLNFDGITDLRDAGIFRAALIGAGLQGATLDNLAAVPEPATYGLLLGAMAMAGAYRHRRARANRV